MSRGCDPDEDPRRWVPPSGPGWDHERGDAVGYSHAWSGDDLVLTPTQLRAEAKRRAEAIRAREQGERRFGFEV